MDNHTSNTSEYKTCTKCGEVKPRSAYQKHPGAGDGLQPACAECRNAANREYKKINEIKIKEAHAKYRLENKEKIIASGVAYRKKNAERERIRLAEWRKVNPDKWKAQSRRFTTKRRLTKKENGIFFIRKKFLEKIYSSPCIICGSFDRVQVDHIIPISLGGRHSEGNLQPLCISCNSSKNNKLMVEWLHGKNKEEK